MSLPVDHVSMPPRPDHDHQDVSDSDASDDANSNPSPNNPRLSLASSAAALESFPPHTTDSVAADDLAHLKYAAEEDEDDGADDQDADHSRSHTMDDGSTGASDARQKRRRATLQQINALDEVFSVNPNPDAEMRKMLAVKCSMSVRSVQIWFQNRRARIRLAKRSGAIIDPNDTAALAVINTVSKRGRKQGTTYPYKSKLKAPLGESESPRLATPTKRMPKYKPTPAATRAAASVSLDGMNPSQDIVNGSGTVFSSGQHRHLRQIPIDTLIWGSWRRTLTISHPAGVHQSQYEVPPSADLQMHMDLLHRNIYLTIASNGAEFRIQVPFEHVLAISAEDSRVGHPQNMDDEENGMAIMTAVTFTLQHTVQHTDGSTDDLSAPRFYMQAANSSDWLSCLDFTEASQATSIPAFTVLAGGGIGGHTGNVASESLKENLMDVISMDDWLRQCFGLEHQQRHHQAHMVHPGSTTSMAAHVQPFGMPLAHAHTPPHDHQQIPFASHQPTHSAHTEKQYMYYNPHHFTMVPPNQSLHQQQPNSGSVASGAQTHAFPNMLSNDASHIHSSFLYDQQLPHPSIHHIPQPPIHDEQNHPLGDQHHHHTQYGLLPPQLFSPPQQHLQHPVQQFHPHPHERQQHQQQQQQQQQQNDPNNQSILMSFGLNQMQPQPFLP
ncbi:hypothetical protein HDU84_003855 [Entophlyctis sp. JEL0112]|nr:hypothetical protein HDU84_003855 [Entophlyctis sp. JEL0112]